MPVSIFYRLGRPTLIFIVLTLFLRFNKLYIANLQKKQIFVKFFSTESENIAYFSIFLHYSEQFWQSIPLILHRQSKTDNYEDFH